MSEKYRGITFAEQSVTPADDAIVRRAILPDGSLTGCEITYSGSTLTMAAGYIIACGRTFQHVFAENWAVVDATSGFARLVLTIDLTKTATESTFDQISAAIEYASSEDGFVGLDQQDINLSGTRYQIVGAVVSLGTGGITGIVSQMPVSRAEGGGLNFRVVDGETQPNDPKENDIWVITPVKVTGYYLQVDQPPEMQPGEVWISIGTASQVAFNAVKKNTVMVYPISAKQMMEDGALVNRTAKSWQNEQWVGWWDGYYLKGADQYEAITGGWIIDGQNKAANKITKNGIELTAFASAPWTDWAATKDAVDFSGIDKILLDVTINTHYIGGGSSIAFAISTTPDTKGEEMATFYVGTDKTHGTHIFELPVAGVSQKGHILIKAQTTSAIVVSNIRKG